MLLASMLLASMVSLPRLVYTLVCYVTAVHTGITGSQQHHTMQPCTRASSTLYTITLLVSAVHHLLYDAPSTYVPEHPFISSAEYQ